jgi:hypothetical protein
MTFMHMRGCESTLRICSVSFSAPRLAFSARHRSSVHATSSPSSRSPQMPVASNARDVPGAGAHLLCWLKGRPDPTRTAAPRQHRASIGAASGQHRGSIARGWQACRHASIQHGVQAASCGSQAEVAARAGEATCSGGGAGQLGEPLPWCDRQQLLAEHEEQRREHLQRGCRSRELSARMGQASKASKAWGQASKASKAWGRRARPARHGAGEQGE